MKARNGGRGMSDDEVKRCASSCCPCHSLMCCDTIHPSYTPYNINLAHDMHVDLSIATSRATSSFPMVSLAASLLYFTPPPLSLPGGRPPGPVGACVWSSVRLANSCARCGFEAEVQGMEVALLSLYEENENLIQLVLHLSVVHAAVSIS